jgi:hypothetical protein
MPPPPSASARPLGSADPWAVSPYDGVMPSARRLYKVTFLSQGQLYEIYARRVNQGGLLGFVEVEGLVWGEKTSVVVDPSEERLQKEFEGVKRSYLPMHSVIRIDEVEKQGQSRITEAARGENVSAFPVPYFRSGGGDSKS